MANKRKPSFPLSVELAPYRNKGEAGNPDTPLTFKDFEREIAERITLARLTLKGSDEAKASVFLSVQLIRGGMMVRIEQDQTDFDTSQSKVARREFRLIF